MRSSLVKLVCFRDLFLGFIERSVSFRFLYVYEIFFDFFEQILTARYLQGDVEFSDVLQTFSVIFASLMFPVFHVSSFRFISIVFLMKSPILSCNYFRICYRLFYIRLSEKFLSFYKEIIDAPYETT